jgi:predicted deacylase
MKPNFQQYFRDLTARVSSNPNISIVPLPHGGAAYHIGRKGRSLAFVSGLHGDETSGPLALQRWISQENMNRIPDDVQIWFFPLLNDCGWDVGVREWNGIDLNRSFKWEEATPPFIKMIMQLWSQEPPLMFLDLHEDSERPDAPYLFQYANDTHDLAHQMASHLGVNVEIWSEFSDWLGSDEIFLRQLGVAHCTTTEAPQDWPLEERIQWNLKAINWMVDYFVFNTGKLPGLIT